MQVAVYSSLSSTILADRSHIALGVYGSMEDLNAEAREQGLEHAFKDRRVTEHCVEISGLPRVSDDPLDNERNPLIAMARLLRTVSNLIPNCLFDHEWARQAIGNSIAIWDTVGDQVLDIENKNEGKI